MSKINTAQVVTSTIKSLKGWLEVPKRRVSQNLRFFRLRGYADTSSSPSSIAQFQLVSRHPGNSDLARRLAAITPESCVSVQVSQKLRPESAQRVQHGDAGKYEFEIEDIEVLNPASPSLPFLPNNEDGVDSLVRAQHRHIEMRSTSLATALKERARLRTQLRSQLENQGFMEVETPLLFKSTPEGAREFLVPTRKKGQFFALPQSPQQYKQILMAGGVHRYYQFAKCFRDEDSRADRQLEFTQLDLEMAFVEMEDVIAAITRVVLAVDDGAPFEHQNGTIKRMKYQDAMRIYGSDKPDLRFDMPISNIEDDSAGDSVDFIQISTDKHWTNQHTNKLKTALKEHDVVVTVQKADTLSVPPSFDAIVSHIPKLSTPSLLLLTRRPRVLSGGSTMMGQCRLLLQQFMEQNNLVTPRQTRPFNLCWITDFPLFSPSVQNEPGQQGSIGLSSTHHPFTAPHPDDISLLESGDRESLDRVRGLHYDLVMNGVEIGGGSIRIHSAPLQRKIFDVLGMSEARIAQFNHLLSVLESGCPPHGGFAMGFDRFVAMYCGKTTIRDVIAFPKTGGGIDALIGSPTQVDPDVLKEYHIAVTP